MIVLTLIVVTSYYVSALQRACDCSAQVVFCNDTCQCIADVLVLGVVQTSVDCISLFEPSRMLES